MRTIVRLVLSLAITGMAATSQANTFDYTYVTNGLEITITGSNQCGVSNAVAIIPDMIDGLPVTTIGDFAFSRCAALTGVTIPSSVASIGYKVFSDCFTLSSVANGDNVRSIG